MLKVNNNIPSFKDFYVLEEGIGSSIIEKLQMIKKELIATDSEGNTRNTKRIHSLGEEIIELLKALGRLNEFVFKKFADMILNELNKNIGKSSIKVGFLVNAIMHLLAIYGAKSFHETKPERYEKQGLGAEYQKAVMDSNK